MRIKSTSLMLATAGTALMLSGCAKDAPEELPPPPPTDTGDNLYDDTLSGPVAGSRADFIAQAGTDTVYFDTDVHELDPEARSILDSQARWLVANPDVRVTIEGHCDERGTREYNLALGERRANSAKNYLAARGVDASRMNVISYGKEQPIALGSDPASWAQNRRAVTVVPM
ncbi:MAG: peptidoglycan-associated lipoprotein Pal [Parasphingopyxis sp.]|nr:peptidoglycan-associated lipoprotein Pal [Sphingomonadales bacterium]